MDDLQDMFDPFSKAYYPVEESLEKLTDADLCGIAGALVAELVNRGNDTTTALETIVDAAKSGAEGSRAFDQMVG